MTLYAVKNNEGKYWDDAEERWTTTACDCWNSKEGADEAASELHSHVVPLVEAPAKVVVSAEEAKALASFKGSINAAKLIYDWACEHKGKGLYTYTQEITLIDRLMRAYVNGWDDKKPKWWNVKAPQKKNDKGEWMSNDGFKKRVPGVDKQQGPTPPAPKWWNIKVPKKWSGDDKHYWTKEQDGALTWAYLINNEYMMSAQKFTESEIIKYGLQNCEKVEVSNKGEKDE